MYIVLLMTRRHKMTKVWMYYMITDGNQITADCKLYFVIKVK